ncbi:SRPBCC family protein [Sphingobacterium sp. LRF_L2]|uniref:SRPBCC family protein n=1 Tax=Sphingobacterium sp. LRF_L2 TaxID=3369421 RepID=UPI003F643A10
MIYTLKRTQYFDCSIEDAWLFFTDPHNLATITPVDLNFKVLDNLDGVGIFEGMLINYYVSPLFNIPLRWQTEIVQVKYQESFVDRQRKGPYALWEHLHEFIPHENGVMMKDTVRYKLPFGVLGRLAHVFLVKRKLHEIFNYRYLTLESILNSPLPY